MTFKSFNLYASKGIPFQIVSLTLLSGCLELKERETSVKMMWIIKVTSTKLELYLCLAHYENTGPMS